VPLKGLVVAKEFALQKVQVVQGFKARIKMRETDRRKDGNSTV
jgi:hypothetical protein